VWRTMTVRVTNPFSDFSSPIVKSELMTVCLCSIQCCMMQDMNQRQHLFHATVEDSSFSISAVTYPYYSTVLNLSVGRRTPVESWSEKLGFEALAAF